MTRIAVMSDLHVVGDDGGRQTTYADLSKSRPSGQDPLPDLLRRINADKLRADILVCPGDITVGACEIGLKSAWSSIQETAKALEATYIFATVGNHDISSREGSTEPEIWERLKLLHPQYPSPNIEEYDRLHYWSEHFFVKKVGVIRFVVLNSCNSHARGKDEYLHGRVTDYTIKRILECLPEDESVELNILLCHHHPFKYPELSQEHLDDSEMTQGPTLLKKLSKHTGPWLVIHGHRHYPSLSFSAGTSTAPTILSAGSISAVLSPVYFSTAVNQFYIVELDESDLAEHGGVGVVRAWDWIKTMGWITAQFDGAKPGKIVDGSGFGLHANLRPIVAKIKSHFLANSTVDWTAIEEAIPELKYMFFDDRVALMVELSKKNLRAVGGTPGRPIELVKS